MKALLLALLSVSVAHAQTIHITGVRRATDLEKTYKTAFNMNMITGSLDGKVYTFQQLAAFGYYHFEVGADYPVVKASDKEVKVRVADKKGRESTESLRIVGIAEQ